MDQMYKSCASSLISFDFVCKDSDLYILSQSCWRFVRIDEIMSPEKYHQVSIHHKIPSEPSLWPQLHCSARQ